MVYCAACGSQNADSARFCTDCGQQMPTNLPAPRTPPPRGRFNRRFWQRPAQPTSAPIPPQSPPPPPTGNFVGQTIVFQQPPQQAGGSGMGTAGMILGIIGVVFAFIPFVGPFVSIPCIAIGLPISVIGFFLNLRRNQGKGMSIAGIICNCIALAMTVISIIITVNVVQEIDEALSEDSSVNTRPTSRSSSMSRSTVTSTSTASGSDSASTVEPSYFSGRSNSYEVGVDIQPGTYRTAGPVRVDWGTCNFARLRTAGASATQTDEVIESHTVKGWTTVTIEESDGGFFTQNCVTWTPVAGSSEASSATTVPGVPTPTVILAETAIADSSMESSTENFNHRKGCADADAGAVAVGSVQSTNIGAT